MMELPHKSSFKLEDVCAITALKPYVIRFWETEFDEIVPALSATGQKIYDERDVRTILKIKKYLFEDKLTIEKAKLRLSEDLSTEVLPLQSTLASPFDSEETRNRKALIREKSHLLLAQIQTLQQHAHL